MAEGAFIEGTNIAVNRDIETKVVAEGIVSIQNNRQSPFGAGWWLDELDHLIVDGTGIVTWAHGDGTTSVFSPGFASEVVAGGASPGFSGDGGQAKLAAFNGVDDLVYDKAGNLFVLDRGNVRVRKIDPAGIVTTYAGNGTSGPGTDGGSATASSLDNPRAIAVDADGNLYIAENATDPLVHVPATKIRKVDPAGIITTIHAGGFNPSLFTPWIRRMVFDARSNTLIAVALSDGFVVRIDPGNAVTRLAGSNMSGFGGDEGLAVDAKLGVSGSIASGSELSGPTGLALDAQGNLYIADSAGNMRVRQVDPAGIIHTFAGTGRSQALQEDVPAVLADMRLGPSAGLAVTPGGDLLIADTLTRLIRRVNANGIIRTIAGKSAAGFDQLASGPARDLQIGPPRAIAVGPAGQIAFCSNLVQPPGAGGPIDSSTDLPNHFIRILTPTLGGEGQYTASMGRFEKLFRRSDGTFERRDRDGSVHVYAADGRKKSWTDRTGRSTTRYDYTGDLLTSITEPTGEAWTLGYAGGKLQTVTDAAGRVTTFTVDGAGNLASIADPDQATVRYEYDSEHRLTKRTSALGFPFAATYSGKGQATRVDLADTAIRRFVPQDSVGLIDDLAAGLGTFCQPAPVVRPDSVVATQIDGRGKPWTYKLDTFRQLLKEVDPLGRTTGWERDGNGLITRMTRPNGSTLSYKYGFRGEVLEMEDSGIPGEPGRGAVWKASYADRFTITTSVVDPHGRPTTTELDVAGNAIRQTDTGGFVEIRAFNERGQPTSVKNRNGFETKYEYAARGNTSKVIHPDGKFRTMTHTTAGYPDVLTDEESHGTKYEYTPYGLASAIVNARQGRRSMEYDLDRRMTAMVDEEGRRTQMEYDRRDRLILVRSPGGRVSTRAYDGEGLQISTKDAKFRETKQEFDDARQIIKRIQPGDVITQFFYSATNDCPGCAGPGGPLGLVTMLVDPIGAETHYSHDPSGRTTRTIDAHDQATNLALDRIGNILRREDPDGLVTQTIYDQRYLPNFTIDPRTGTTDRSFDNLGNTVRERNAKGEVTQREFDSRNRLIRLTKAAGTTDASTVRFSYDGAGNLKVLTTPNGSEWKFEYDELNRLVKETDPGGRAELYEYDKVGNVTKKTSRNGEVTAYRYNLDNEKTGITYHDGSTVSIDRDDTGQVTRVADGTVTVNRTYDDLDRLETESIPLLNITVRQEFDKVSNRTALTINGARSTYEFDKLHRVKKLNHASGATAEWEYDPIGLVTKKKLPNGVVMDATFDHRRLKQMVYKNALGAALATFAYEHDAIANITKMVDNEGQHTYSYDAQSRLVEVQYPFSFVDPNAMTGETFKLDPSGNRVEHTITRGTRIETETASFDASDRILGSRITALVPPGQTAELEARSFEHDMNGAMVRQTVTSTPPGSLTSSVAATDYVYDARQQLVQVRLSTGQVVDQQYFPDSPLRLWFTDAATGAQTRQVWDPSTQNPLQDLDGTNALVTDYLMGNRIDEPLGRVVGGVTHALLGDHLMTIRALVDSAGVPVNQYTYAAFGAGRSQVEAVANRLRFTARELDPSTGLQFNRHRHYLAGLGRWTQRDPMGMVDGPNQYAYVGANPIARVDPTGLAWNPAECAKAMEELRNLIYTCNQLPCGDDREACLAAATGIRRRIVENCPPGPNPPRPIPLPIPVPTPTPVPEPPSHYRPIPAPPWWIIIPILIPFPGNPIYGGI